MGLPCGRTTWGAALPSPGHSVPAETPAPQRRGKVESEVPTSFPDTRNQGTKDAVSGVPKATLKLSDLLGRTHSALGKPFVLPVTVLMKRHRANSIKRKRTGAEARRHQAQGSRRTCHPRAGRVTWRHASFFQHRCPNQGCSPEPCVLFVLGVSHVRVQHPNPNRCLSPGSRPQEVHRYGGLASGIAKQNKSCCDCELSGQTDTVWPEASDIMEAAH